MIEDTAAYFGTSKTAMFLRYREYGDFPVMILFIENGIIKWEQTSTDFSYKYLSLNSAGPSYTVAGNGHCRGVEEKTPEKVEAIEWFLKDYVAKQEAHRQLWNNVSYY